MTAKEPGSTLELADSIVGAVSGTHLSSPPRGQLACSALGYPLRAGWVAGSVGRHPVGMETTLATAVSYHLHFRVLGLLMSILASCYHVHFLHYTSNCLIYIVLSHH